MTSSCALEFVMCCHLLCHKPMPVPRIFECGRGGDVQAVFTFWGFPRLNFPVCDDRHFRGGAVVVPRGPC